MALNLIPEEKKQRISHGIAGAVILIKAYGKFEHGDVLAGSIIALAGAFFVLYAALHRWLHQFSFQRHLETGLFLAEAVVMAVIAANYFHHGKRALPWCYVAVTIAYLGLAVRQHRRNARPEHSLSPHQH